MRFMVGTFVIWIGCGGSCLAVAVVVRAAFNFLPETFRREATERIAGSRPATGVRGMRLMADATGGTREGP